MTAYFFRRFFLIIPTLLAIMVINFTIVQFAPGGPIEQMIARLKGGGDPMSRLSGSMPTEGISGGMGSESYESKYAGSYGLDPEFIKKLEILYGFDKPPVERFLKMMGDYCRFDFGDSYFKGAKVVDLVIQKMPVSLSLGLWSTFIIYLISIPLGIRKAVHHGTSFDLWTSTVIILGYAIPSFLFGIFLIVLLAGGSFWSLFPLRGLVSENWHTLSTIEKILDYAWHMTLPILAIVISGFASLTLLTKNAFLEEIHKNYVLTARAKGLTETRVLYGHVFRNAILVLVSGLPGAFLHILFTGSLLIEVIFSLDGLGLLGFEAVVGRDYPIVFGTLFFFTLLSLFLHLVGDIVYTLVDRRIDFERKGA